MMTLDKAKTNIPYTIKAVDIENQAVLAKMVNFGLIEGAEVKVKRFAPIFRDPLLIEVDGIQLMVSKEHARFLTVQESV